LYQHTEQIKYKLREVCKIRENWLRKCVKEAVSQKLRVGDFNPLVINLMYILLK